MPMSIIFYEKYSVNYFTGLIFSVRFPLPMGLYYHGILLPHLLQYVHLNKIGFFLQFSKICTYLHNVIVTLSLINLSHFHVYKINTTQTQEREVYLT